MTSWCTEIAGHCGFYDKLWRKHCEIRKCCEVANIWVVEMFEFHFLLHELMNF